MPFPLLYSTAAFACLLAQSCPTLCNLMDISLPGSSVHGIFSARIQEWVAISSSRESSQPRDRTCIYWVTCTAGRLLTAEPQGKPLLPRLMPSIRSPSCSMTDTFARPHHRSSVSPSTSLDRSGNSAEMQDC